MPDYNTYIRACAPLDDVPIGSSSMFGFEPAWVLAQLGEGAICLEEIEQHYIDSPESLAGFYSLVTQLIAGRLVEYTNDPSGGLALRITANQFELPQQQLLENSYYRLSKFTVIRSNNGIITVEHPLSTAFSMIHDPGLMPLVHAFSQPRQPQGCHPPQLSCLNLLLNSGCLVECDASGVSHEETNADLAHWEFHDLLFHTRSRPGKHGFAAGNTYRQASAFPEPASTKDNPWQKNHIALPLPDGTRRNWVLDDIVQVLLQRRTHRQFSTTAMNLNTLSEFLYLLFNNKPDSDTKLFPSSGGIYELEPYLYLDRCMGVPPGFYYYDNGLHALCPISPTNAETEAIMQSAQNTMLTSTRPQVILCLASRFLTMSYKYESVSYALQLKDVGAIFTTMYLLATAMGLAPCALGSGCTEEFGRLTHLPLVEESLVGEFALGC